MSAMPERTPKKPASANMVTLMRSIDQPARATERGLPPAPRSTAP